jgi:T5orf172 domain
MIDVEHHACERFQRVASAWLRSGEISRTNHVLSPLEELAGFNYGFVYLLDLGENAQGRTVKLGWSENPVRRIRELRTGHRYGEALRLRACFAGEQPEERALHQRFAHLRVENERFMASAAIDTEFLRARERMRARLRALHLCSAECPQLVRHLDLRMLGAWLRR